MLASSAPTACAAWLATADPDPAGLGPGRPGGRRPDRIADGHRPGRARWTSASRRPWRRWPTTAPWSSSCGPSQPRWTPRPDRGRRRLSVRLAERLPGRPDARRRAPWKRPAAPAGAGPACASSARPSASPPGLLALETARAERAAPPGRRRLPDPARARRQLCPDARGRGGGGQARRRLAVDHRRAGRRPLGRGLGLGRAGRGR